MSAVVNKPSQTVQAVDACCKDVRDTPATLPRGRDIPAVGRHFVYSCTGGKIKMRCINHSYITRHKGDARTCHIDLLHVYLPYHEYICPYCKQ